MLRSLVWTMAALSAFVAATPSAALERRPTISTAESCVTDDAFGRSNWDCDGSICSCCYSDGCWICDGEATGSGFGDCVWEQAFRPGGAKPPFGGTDGVLDPNAADPGMTLHMGPPATLLEQQ